MADFSLDEHYGSDTQIIYTFLLSVFFSSGQPKGVCVSPGGRFPAFSSEGKPPYQSLWLHFFFKKM